MAGTPESDEDTQIGLKAVEAGLITEVQLATVLRDRAKQASPASVADTLVSRGLLTRLQVEGFRTGGLGASARRIGKYRLLRELGRGGMGIVYEAEDVELKRRCALKTLIEVEDADPGFRAREEERFVREARLCANLPRHPAIVGVYEAGVVDGRRILAMELVEGLQFQDWREKSKASLRVQVQVLKEAADAVAHAHQHGIIHRDLKPSNLLVDGQRKPRVTDFGLAKRSRETTVGGLTGSGVIVGTPAYMSPEQAEAKEDIGPSTDQWALGVMLYEILTDRLPFRGASAVEVIMKTVQDPVVPPSQVLHGKVDERLERICMRALKKDPTERFPGVKAFAEQLGAWLKGAAPAKPAAKAPKAPWLPVAVAAGVLLAILGVYVLFRPDSAPPPVDVGALVARGRAQIRERNYVDAIVSFGKALDADPKNTAAEAGKREAERLMKAGAAEVEIVAGLRKRIGELDFLGVLERLDGEEGRRISDKAQSELRAELRKLMQTRWTTIRDRALAARKIGDAGQVRALVAEVDSWKQKDLSDALKTALASAPPPPAPPPAPSAPPATASPLPPAPPAAPAPPPTAARFVHLRHGMNGVLMVAVSPDSKRVLSGSYDGTAKYWDLASPDEPLKIFTYTERANGGAFSPDGRWIALGLGDGRVVLIDVRTFETKSWKPHDPQIMALVFSPDSRTLYTTSVDGTLKALSVPDGAEKAAYGHHRNGAMSVALTADGATAAVGTASGEVRLWDLKQGKAGPTWSAPAMGGLYSVAFSPDGARVAAGGNQGPLVVWDVKTGAPRTYARDEKRPLFRVSWSPDGRWIAGASTGDHLKVWDAASGALKAVLTDSENGCFSCAFSPDGRRLVGGGHDWQVRAYDFAAVIGK